MKEPPDLIPSSRQAEPRVPAKMEEFFAAMTMALICLITFANVVVRYFTDESFAFTEELSVFLLVVLAFVGASAAFAKNTHIRVTFFVERLPEGVAFWAEMAVVVTGLALFSLISGYGVRLALDDLRFETTSPGIGVPQWFYSVWLPVLSAVIALRLLGRLIRLFRGGA